MYKRKLKKCLTLLKESKLDSLEKTLNELLNEEIITTVNDSLKPIEDNCFNILRNSENEWWELNVGIPSSWEVKDNNDIGFDILNSSDLGKQIHVFPKKENVTIDDLILFVKIIIKTNQEIEEKERTFTEEIKKMKEGLEEKIKSFYEKLEFDKENAFKSLDVNFEKEFSKSKTEKKSDEESENDTENKKSK